MTIRPWQPKIKRSTYNSNVTCYKCGKRGHIQLDCRSKPKSGNNYKQDPKSFNSTRAHEATDDFAFAGTDIALPTLTGESWLADSACTSHISRNKNLFQTYTPTPGHKVSGFGNVDGLGRGTVKLESTVNGDTHDTLLHLVIITGPVTRAGSWVGSRTGRVRVQILWPSYNPYPFCRVCGF